MEWLKADISDERIIYYSIIMAVRFVVVCHLLSQCLEKCSVINTRITII